MKQTLKSSNRDSGLRESDVKGNVDVDLTLGVWRESSNYHKAIIVSGDGDFTSLIKHLLDEKKLKNIIVPKYYSSLFKQFNEYIVELNSYKNELVYVKSVKTPDVKTAKSLKKPAFKPLNKKVAAVGAANSVTTRNRHKIKQTLKRKIHIFNKN